MMINLTMLGQVYELKEIAKVVWISSALNHADATKKDNTLLAVKNLINDYMVNVFLMSWVKRRDLNIRDEMRGQEERSLFDRKFTCLPE